MKVITVGDTNPVSSLKRVAEAAVIPPYTFSGRLRTGTSPWWSPHSNYDLTQGYVQARTAGTSQAGFAIMKVAGGSNYFNTDVANHVVVGAIVMGPSTLKKRFDLREIVGPYDSIYIASFAASGHEDVVIQILGEKL